VSKREERRKQKRGEILRPTSFHIFAERQRKQYMLSDPQSKKKGTFSFQRYIRSFLTFAQSTLMIP